MIDIEREDVLPETVVGYLGKRGVQLLATGPRRLRAVTHLDVDDEGIDRACAAFGALVDELAVDNRLSASG